MAMEPASQEREVRYAVARSWSTTPIVEEGEDLLAERADLEARHAIERRQWEARFARYLLQSVKPVEMALRKRKPDPPDQEQESGFRAAS